MVSSLLFVSTNRKRRNNKLAIFLGCCALVSGLVACGGSSGNNEVGGTPSSGVSTIIIITLTPTAPSIQAGQTQQFVATAIDASGNPIPGVTFTWVSSDPTVASITNSGLATGLLMGSTTITATSGMMNSNPSTLTVTASTVSLITLTPPAPSIQAGQTQQFMATAMDASGNSIPGMTFTWASSDSIVASIASTGLATGLSGGTTTITASAGGITSSGVQLLVTLATIGGRVYTTNFPLAENPISEGSNWINGKAVGLDWADIATTPGLAHGTESGSTGFDDSTALLTGPWGPDQTVTATVHSVNQSGSAYEEVEIRLRSSLSAHSCTGYEVNFRALKSADSYAQIVRWNGPLNDFTYLNSGSGEQFGVSEGDIVKASIIGNVITVYINDVQILQATDNTYSSGNPGMGFFLSGPTGVNGDYGFTSFTASD